MVDDREDDRDRKDMAPKTVMSLIYSWCAKLTPAWLRKNKMNITTCYAGNATKTNVWLVTAQAKH